MSPKRKKKRKENKKKKKNQINKKNNKTRYGISGLIQRNLEHSPKGLSNPNAVRKNWLRVIDFTARYMG